MLDLKLKSFVFQFSLAATINALFWPNFLFLLGVVLLVGGFCCK